MRRLFIVIQVLFFVNFVYADNVTEVLMGPGYAEDIEKFGLTTDVTFYKDMNYMFSLGVNPGFSWYQWDRAVLDQSGNTITETKTVGDSDVVVTKKTKANAFLFPVLVVAKIQYPVLPTVIPYINGGLGYSIMPLSYDDEHGEAQTDMYQGFSWKTGAGVAIRVPDIPDFRFIAEVAYRNIPVSDNDDFELSMSGVTILAGIQYGRISEKNGAPSRLGGW